MRLYAAILLALVTASAARAQLKQAPAPPAEHGSLDGLTGKDQAAPAGKAMLGETQEQHDHYIVKESADQHITSDSVRSNNVDH